MKFKRMERSAKIIWRTGKAIKKQKQKLIEQAKRIANPKYGKTERDEIMLYNSMAMGLQNYFRTDDRGLAFAAAADSVGINIPTTERGQRRL